MGSAADLLRAGADRRSDDISRDSAGWPTNPRALAGRLRRAQTFLRALGIEIAFAREGRTGTRVIRIHTMFGNTVNTVGTVSSVRHNGLTLRVRYPANFDPRRSRISSMPIQWRHLCARSWPRETAMDGERIRSFAGWL